MLQHLANFNEKCLADNKNLYKAAKIFFFRNLKGNPIIKLTERNGTIRDVRVIG